MNVTTIYSIDFSPSGNLLAAGDNGGRIRVWETNTWKRTYCIENQEDGILIVKFNPSGELLATGSGGTGKGHLLKLWDVETGNLIHTLDGHSLGIYALDFSPDGKMIASGSADNYIFLWDIEKGKIDKRLTGHKETLYPRIYSTAFSRMGNFLVSGGSDCTLRLWNIDSNDTMIIANFKDFVRSVRFSPDGKFLLAGAEDGVVKIWDWIDLISEGITLETSRIDTSSFIHPRRVCSVDFHEKYYIAAGTADDGILWVWSLETGDVIFKEAKHVSFVWGVRFCPKKHLLASCGEDDACIYVWDFVTHKLMAELQAND